MRNNNITNEEWRPIKGINGYRVSNLGRVIGKRGHVLKASPDHRGYPVVGICDHGHQKHINVHRLVAKAFLHNPDPSIYTDVNHIDGDKTNNRVENLEWCTKRHNLYHAYRTGLMPVKMPTGEEIKEIRRLYAEGEDMNIIADKFRISYGTIKAHVAGIHRRRVSKKNRREIKKLYENGARAVDLAKQFDCHESTIHHIVKDTKRHAKRIQEDKERALVMKEMKALHDKGVPVKEIAQMYNVSVTCARQRIKREAKRNA